MSSQRRLELSEEEYLDIEEALASNARGRSFLRMRDQRARLVAMNEVRKLARDLKESVKVGGGQTEDKRDEAHIRILREELREMSAYIHQTRREIAALRPTDAGSNRIMAATGELDAIVSATERATSEILNGVERIQDLTLKLPKTSEITPIVDEIQAQVTEVLTACSFQDITGQRTTKVVNTLRYLEQRVNSMIEIWGVDGAPPAPPPPENEDRRPDAHLMHGPAADGGPSQADVDALFERLGNATATPAPGAAPAAAAAPSPAPQSEPAGEKSSQSQIDALFNAAQ
ncbi:MAG TPA: protein phosphatase CheZ [Stellaceae bacterium]|nr:protein phosphatase CheZ [Stellaceae bacterium]